MRTAFVLSLLLATACGGEEATPAAVEAAAGAGAEGAPAEAPEERWSASRTTQGRKYQVSLEMVPSPPPMGELFTVRATVRDREGNPVEDAKVALNARMPQHDHGMETDPVDEPGVCDDEGECTHPGGVYETSGFKFHMGGEWTITVLVQGPMGPDNTSFVYDMR